MDYFIPSTLIEAQKLRNTRNKKYIYLAGGTIINWRHKPAADGLIDLNYLGIDKIHVSKSTISIGATATIQQIADDPDIPGPLRYSAISFTSPNVRNMATIGGTIAGNFFISNLLPTLLAYKSTVSYFNEGKHNKISLQKWLSKQTGLLCSVNIADPQRTVMTRQEKISSIDFPLIVTSLGFKIKNKKIADPVLAISGACAKIQTIGEISSYLSATKPFLRTDKEFDRMISTSVKVTRNPKAGVTVKRNIIKDHIISIAEDLTRKYSK
ncbi:FAD binding domain-containing protein [Elusimicrobiota bacterium]